jgi:hypothetical protein
VNAAIALLNGEVKYVAKKTDPCWDGYTQVGMKMKNGKKVPNCVPAKGVPKSKPKKKVSK